MKLQGIKNKNIKWWIGVTSFAALFLVIIFFGYKKMSFVWRGVRIEATMEEKDGSELYTIRGNARKAAYISLNGREIFVDKDGNFKESISVLPGFSIVTLNAKDKFGKTAEKKFEVVVDSNAKAIAFKDSEINNN